MTIELTKAQATALAMARSTKAAKVTIAWSDNKSITPADLEAAYARLKKRIKAAAE